MAKVPVLTFDIGAVGDRVKKDKLGWVIPFDEKVDKILEKIQDIRNNRKEYNKIKNNFENYKYKTTEQMQEEYKKRNMIISNLLDEKIKDRISKDEQIIILLNRRGFTTIVNCKNCGYTFKCPYCDITLTYHKTSNNLRCQYFHPNRLK